MSDGNLIIGLMSGSSVDGIDAALVEFHSANQLRVLETQFTPFDQELRNAINALALSVQIESPSETHLHAELASHYANASLSLLAKSGHKPSEISAIANHGQTVRHEPNASPPYSLQLGDSQLIANISGIKTLAQFRQADLAAGGQGAPLMPAFHNAVFKNTGLILNIGGIANLTQLGETVIGFDTGPGNTLMDQWINAHKGKSYDADGQWANSGRVQPNVLDQLLGDQYFALSAPKSTGTDYFNLAWLRSQIPNLDQYAPEDIQATLLALTANSIASSITQRTEPTTVYICGGGAHNTALLQALKNTLPEYTIDLTDTLGVPSDWVESVGFAWLGYCKLHTILSSLPSVTGASEPRVLGEVFEPE